MEKLKRSPSKRPYVYLLLLTAIFILGFALGIFALDTFRASQNTTAQTTIAEASQSCAPTARFYAEPTVVAIQPEVYAQSTNVVSGQQSTGGVNAPIPTSVALMNVSTTATQLAEQYYATPSPSANNGVGGNSNNTAYIAPTINGPATYTPMPVGSPVAMLTMGISTPYPQNQRGATTSTTAQTVPLDTELRNPLRAGEIDDNAEWDVYLTYRENFYASPAYASPVDDVDVSQRQLIRVVNAEGQPILGAYVEILNANGAVIHSSCTYATGYTLFFPNLYDDAQEENFHVRVSKNEASVEGDLQLSDETLTLELNVEQENPKLDLLFLIDATGSMDDEIAQLTNNILYISEQIDALPDEVDVRYALVSFKDGYYPTQVWDFTSDVNLFQTQLATLFTAGGDGETLNDGLDRSVNQVHWRGADTVKLVFLVGDEPPGVYENHPSYAISMMEASSYGIKVHPIASSGLDVQGEYIFRQIAQATMGSFIFLSYDNGATAVQETGSVAGSTGNDAFGEYNVEQLDEIVLKLIRQELAAGYSEQ